SPAARSEASRPERARSRWRSRARSAWLAPTSTSITPKSRNAAKASPIKLRSPSSLAARAPAVESSDHPELEARGLRHALRGPRRVPDHLDGRGDDARHRARLGLDLGRKRFGGGAHRRGERHPDAGLPRLVDADVVDEAELVDVDGNLGIV